MDVRRGEGASSDLRVCKRSSEEKGKRVDGGARDQTLERFASTEKAGRCRARPVTRRPAGAAFAGRVNANMAIRRLPETVYDVRRKPQDARHPTPKGRRRTRKTSGIHCRGLRPVACDSAAPRLPNSAGTSSSRRSVETRHARSSRHSAAPACCRRNMRAAFARARSCRPPCAAGGQAHAFFGRSERDVAPR